LLDLENMTHTEERIRTLTPLLKTIITETAANRDSWVASDVGMDRKTLRRKVEAAKNRSDSQENKKIIESKVSSLQPAHQDTHIIEDKIKFKELEDYRNKDFFLKLEKAQVRLLDQMINVIPGLGSWIYSWF